MAYASYRQRHAILAPRSSFVGSCNVSGSSVTGNVSVVHSTFGTRAKVAVLTMPYMTNGHLSAHPRVPLAANRKVPNWDRTHDFLCTNVQCDECPAIDTVRRTVCDGSPICWDGDPLSKGKPLPNRRWQQAMGPPCRECRPEGAGTQRQDRTSCCMTAIDARVALGQKASARCA